MEEKTIGISSMHPRREQKLKEMIDSVGVSSTATGITLYFTGLIKGSRPRTWNSNLSIFGAIKNETHGSIKQMWDIRLERPTGSPDLPKYLCVQGALKVPILPIWNTRELRLRPIEFVFENKISMGMSSCNESSISTSGSAKVSEQQKEFSRTSLESIKCQEMVQRGELASKSSHACKTENLQARTLDTIELTNQFNRVPEFVKRWEQRLVTFAKSYFWPFTSSIQISNNPVSGNTFTTTLRIEFLQWARAFDLSIKRPKENFAFSTVRIPYPLTLFAPLKAGLKNLALATEKFPDTGALDIGFYDNCIIAENSFRKFDGIVVPLNNIIDGCYHVLFKADMYSSFRSLGDFSVEAKKIPGCGHKRSLMHYGIKVTFENDLNVITNRELILDLDHSCTRPTAQLQYSNGTTINEWNNGEDVNLLLGRYNLHLHHPAVIVVPGIVYLRLDYMHQDFPTLLEPTTLFTMSFDGEEINLFVEHSYIETSISDSYGQAYGICGKFKRFGGALNEPQSCTYTKSILEVASNRIQTASCPEMEQSVKEQLQKEKAKCLETQTSSIQL
jgi:hypothetical protein